MHKIRVNTATIFCFLLALSGLLNAACSSTGISKTTNTMTAGSSIIESKRSFKIKEDKTFQKGPYQMQETKSSIVIMWETPTKTISTVEYGLTDTLGQKQTLLEPVTIHEVEITGLTAETVYFYRVGDGTTWSKSFTFRTAVEPTTPFRFAAYSDSQEKPRIHRRIVDRIMAQEPSFVLHSGDEVSDGRVWADWGLFRFEPTRPLGHLVPYYVAIGNHEHNADWFYRYSSYPFPKDDPQHESYYDFTFGNAYFIIIDTNKLPGPQYAWVEERLQSEEARKATWRFAAFHNPAYTNGWGKGCGYSGDVSLRDTLIPLLEKYGVNVIYNGHMHGYSRGFLDGVYHIIDGGGGSALDAHCRSFPHITKEAYVYHFVMTEVFSDRLEIRAIDVNGNEIDHFTVRK